MYLKFNVYNNIIFCNLHDPYELCNFLWNSYNQNSKYFLLFLRNLCL